MNKRKLRIIRQSIQRALSVLPFNPTLKLIEVLRGSQGLGFGASVTTSGEIQAVSRFLNDSKNKSLVILDVGANRGEWTAALQKFFPDAQYFLFEPSPKTFDLLVSKFRARNVVTFNIGLSNKKTEATLQKHDAYSRTASLYNLPGSVPDFSEKVRLDQLGNVYDQLNISGIDLLKLDVEGHELDVLKGAEDLLKKQKISLIQFEYGETNLYSHVFLKDIFEFLVDYNFSIYLIKHGKLVNLPKYMPRLECFTPTNFLARLN